ncbi:MAG: hypothetical protein ACOH5I_08010 [Oligoflexus sp.]
MHFQWSKILLSCIFMSGLMATTSCKDSSQLPANNWPKPDDNATQTPESPRPMPENSLGEAPSPDSEPALPVTDDIPIDREEPIAAVTSRLCRDADFGRHGLEACLLADETLLSRFDRLELQFSLRASEGDHQLKRSSIEENLFLRDSQERIIATRFNWRTLRSLIIEPEEPLAAGQNYRLELINERQTSNRPRSNKGELVQPFAIWLRTKSLFPVGFHINGQDLSIERSVVFDSHEDPDLKLSVELGDADLMSNLVLKKIGSQNSLELCQSDCPANLQISLHDIASKPHAGVNSYYLEWTTPWQSIEQRHLSFIWGSLATELDKPQVIQLAVDEKQSLKMIAELLQSFIAGNFPLALPEAGGKAYHFNDLLQSNRYDFPEDRPNHCLQPDDVSFTYLGDLGPFCNIQIDGQTGVLGGLLGRVNYKATSDIYVTGMTLLEEPDNIQLALRAEDGHMGLDLGVRHFRGSLKIIIDIEDARLAGISAPGTKGIYIFETDFILAGPHRQASAHVDVSILEQRLAFRLNGLESFDFDRSLNGSRRTASYFNTSDWARNVIVEEPKQLNEDLGLWARIVNAIVNQAVAEKVVDLTPRVVNGIARDIIQVVAPKPLQSILNQIDQGLEIPLPFFLPQPYASMSAKVSGKLQAPIRLSKEVGKGGFLQSGFAAAINLNDHPDLSAPPMPEGPASFVLMGEKTRRVADPLSLYPLMTAPEGALASVHIDFINQLLFQIWQKGALQIRIDEAFTRHIESFAVFDPERQSNGKEILLIEFIPKLLGRDFEKLRGLDEWNRPVNMQRGDQVSLDLELHLPPHLRILPFRSQNEAPRFELAAGDIFITIRGHREDLTYTIAKIRMAVSSSSQLGFRSYSNPFDRPFFNDLGALSLQVYSDAANLDFVVEVLGDSRNNPFAIDHLRIERAVREMVDELFIPLMNDALREVPLPGLKTCGIELDAVRIRMHSFPSMELEQTLLIEAPLKSYPFQSLCKLAPDFIPPEDYEPVPPVIDEPEPLPPTGDYVFDMNTDRLPFTIGGDGQLPEVAKACRSAVFFELSCATAEVIYQKDANGQTRLDERGRKIYDFTTIQLYALVAKKKYVLHLGDKSSIEGQFFAFEQWSDYVRGAEDHIIIKESLSMPEIDIPFGRFQRHYVDYATNSPKASGFIPIRNVTLNRILDQAYPGAEVSTEFFVDTSSYVEVPEGRKPLRGAFGLDFHVGNIHVLDCAKIDWCQDKDFWLVMYDSKLRPEDTSIPEDVVPYLRTGLNAILSGMFPD